MGMDAGGSSGGPSSDINVTPLVDVCLVLLIIFMVMTPKVVPEISVRVPPDKKSKTPPKESTNLVVGLNKDGGMFLNKEPMSGLDQLQDELKTRIPSLPKKVVFVDFDNDAKYGKAVEILGVAKRSGADVLGIVKRKEEKNKMPEKISDVP